MQERLEEEGLTRTRVLEVLSARPGLVVNRHGKPVDVRAALEGKVCPLLARLRGGGLVRIRTHPPPPPRCSEGA